MRSNSSTSASWPAVKILPSVDRSIASQLARNTSKASKSGFISFTAPSSISPELPGIVQSGRRYRPLVVRAPTLSLVPSRPLGHALIRFMFVYPTTGAVASTPSVARVVATSCATSSRYTNRISPPSSFGENRSGQSAREGCASVQTHSSGVFKLPVGTQAQVTRRLFRIVERMLSMAPPSAVRAGATGPLREGVDGTAARITSLGGVSLGYSNPWLTRSNHRSCAGMSAQKKSPGTRRFLCGFFAHKVEVKLRRAGSPAGVFFIVPYPPRV